MGNIVSTFKRFLSNKNTITILGVLLGLVVLFVGYNYRVKTAVDTVDIPYAKKTISAASEITSDAVGTMKILRSTINENKNLISDINRVLSASQRYCVSERSSVPEGGFFYTEQVKSCNLVNRDVLDNMPDGYKPVAIPVNLQTTYGNSMFPGDYIDLYAKMYTDEGKLIYEELVTKLPIMDVRDNNGMSIYYSNDTTGSPAMLLFAVPEELFSWLAKATLLTNVVELVPLPGNASYSAEVGETKVTNNRIKDVILEHTVEIKDEDIPDFS